MTVFVLVVFFGIGEVRLSFAVHSILLNDANAFLRDCQFASVPFVLLRFFWEEYY